MSIFTRFLINLIARVTFFIFTLDVRISERFDISFRKRHLSRQVLSRSDELLTTNKFAIFAAYPKIETLASTLRIRNYLHQAGFTTIFVVNRNAQAKRWISELEHLGDTILVRPNLGHDFGAYQAGIAFLKAERLLPQSQQLVLVNDSVIFTPNSEEMLRSTLSRPHPWQSLTISTRPTLHAQSYFVSFLPEVFLSVAFSNFWKHYYPTSLRHLVIRDGELGLSRRLIKAGWLPHPVTMDLTLEPIAARSTRMKLPEAIALFSHEHIPHNMAAVPDEVVRNRISHQLYEGNPSKILGLYLARKYGFPLKRDLLYGRLYSLDDVINCLRDCGIEEFEAEQLQDLYLSTLSVQNGLLTSLWRKSGLVR